MHRHVDMLYRLAAPLSHYARCVLHVLCHCADERGRSFPSTAYIARQFAMSRSSAMRGIEELVASGLVRRETGRGNRHTNVYVLLVDNFRQMYLTDTFEDGQMCPTDTLNVSDRNIKCICGTHTRDQEPANKSVSMYAGGEGVPVDNSRRTPPGGAVTGVDGGESATPSPVDSELSAEYMKLVSTFGWIPRNRRDMEACATLCYTLGCEVEESKRFCRFNATRHWSGVGETCSVKYLAQAWVERWRAEHPDAADYERRRREFERASRTLS